VKPFFAPVNSHLKPPALITQIDARLPKFIFAVFSQKQRDGRATGDNFLSVS